MIKDLKIRCDYRKVFEFGGTPEVDEIRIPSPELKTILKRGEINEALRMLEPVDIREHRFCCVPVNDWGQMMLSKERLAEIVKGYLS